jgi:signal peptidase II
VTVVLIVAAIVVVLDQISKMLVLDRLAPGVSIDVVDGLVSFTLVMNPGLAFGLLGELPSTWRWLIALLSLGALFILARVAVRVLAEGGRLDRLAVGLIFGGAVGNLVDRARFGAVVDFVDVHYAGFHWWAFNVADSAITVGVALLALRLIVRPSPPTVG